MERAYYARNAEELPAVADKANNMPLPRRTKKRLRSVPVKDIWLDRLEVLMVLNISRWTLNKLIKKGLFPQGVVFNRKLVRWKKSVVDQYIREL